MTISTTIDGLLDRRVQLEQPAEGYRVAVDTVLLPAVVPAQTGQRVLDLGCGVGGAMLCLACRVPGITATGIDISEDIIALCCANIARNIFAAGCDAHVGDAARLPDDLAGQFDHVLMNPPYHEASKHDVSADARKRAANTETDGDLKLWIASARQALKSDGMLTLIHRADRLDEIMGYLTPAFGAVDIFPILPKTGQPPRRIILRARKGAAPGVQRHPDFVLHAETGGYTDRAENILRQAAALTV